MQAFTITLTPMEPLHQNEQNKTCLSTRQRKSANESECAELESPTHKSKTKLWLTTEEDTIHSLYLMLVSKNHYIWPICPYCLWKRNTQNS